MDMTAKRWPGWWVPTLYFVQGLPNTAVNNVAYLALLALGWPTVDAGLYTNALYLPWVIKPLWGPLVERHGTRRAWVLAMQMLGGVVCLGIAWALPVKGWIAVTVGLLLALGFVSATHDIACDGFYMVAMGERRQTAWSGMRSAFFKLAVVMGSGELVVLAGRQEKVWGLAAAWQAVYVAFAVALMGLAIYHAFALPHPEREAAEGAARAPGESWMVVWTSFVQRPGFPRMLAYMLLYRVGEGQLLKGNLPFFLAPRAAGGLALRTEDVGWLYGTVGTCALLFGGILGGWVIARTGLRRQLWPMVLALNVPHLAYVWLAWAQPANHLAAGAGIALESFGYGYGYAAYMVYLLYIARGPYPTAHYALCTGGMALGLMGSGYLGTAMLDALHNHYLTFFLWVAGCSVVSLATVWKLPLAGDFGRRE